MLLSILLCIFLSVFLCRLRRLLLKVEDFRVGESGLADAILFFLVVVPVVVAIVVDVMHWRHMGDSGVEPMVVIIGSVSRRGLRHRDLLNGLVVVVDHRLCRSRLRLGRLRGGLCLLGLNLFQRLVRVLEWMQWSGSVLELVVRWLWCVRTRSSGKLHLRLLGIE